MATVDTEDRPWLRRCFEIDLRALAAMRIGIALVTLWDLASRAQLMVSHYSDVGFAPRELFWASRLQSVYFLAPHGPASAHFAAAMFVLHALFAIVLLVGYRTRLATLACLVMSWSLTARNPAIVHGGDSITVWLLIWSLFLPLGAVASVNAHTARSRPDNPICTFATVALLLQVIVIYLGALVAKLDRHWWIELDAVHYFLLTSRGTPLGNAVSSVAVLTALLTIATLVLEGLGPWVALFAGKKPILRTAVVLCFIVMHIGFAATLYVGTFGWVCVVAWLPFVPVETWDALSARVSVARLRRISGSVLDGIARIIDRGWLAVRHIGDGDSTVTRAIILAMAAYLVPAALAANLPPPLARYFGPFTRLPKLKQAWTMMNVVWLHRIRMSIDATLDDGQVVKLLDSAPIASRGGLDYLWPPENARLIAYEWNVMNRAAEGSPALSAAWCAKLRRDWDASHSQGQRIRTMVMYADCWQVAAFDTPLKKSSVTRQKLYSWSRDEPTTTPTLSTRSAQTSP